MRFLLAFSASAALAFTPNPTLTNLADNTAMDLGAYPCVPSAGDGSYPCNNITDYSGMTYDSAHCRMLMFGGGHATTFVDAIEAFDFSTLTWSALYTATACAEMTPSNLDRTNGAWIAGTSGPFPRPISRHTYDELLAPPGLGEFIILAECNGGQSACPKGFDWSSSDPFFMGAHVAHYSFQSGTWSFSATAQGAELPAGGASYPSTAYDPVSGKVVILGRYGLSTYDPVAKTKVRHVRGDWGELVDSAGTHLADGELSGWCNLTYYPPNQRFYYMDRGYSPSRVYELQLNRSNLGASTVTRIATTGTPPPSNESGFDYDAVNQIIGGGVAGSMFYAYNPVTHAWDAKSVQGGSPGTVAFHALGYDPVNNVFVFINTGSKHTWAYRYKKGSGTGREGKGTPRLGSGQEGQIQISPNPARGVVKIGIQGYASATASISIMDVKGRMVGAFQIGKGVRETVWNTQGLSSGIYLIRRLENGNAVETKNILVVK